MENFEFNAELENIDGVPEKYQGLYEKTESGFRLDTTLSEKLDVSGLKKALHSERENNRSMTRLLKGFQEIAESPEAIMEKLNTPQSKKTDDTENKEDLEAKLEKRYSSIIKEREDEIQKTKTLLSNTIVASEINQALVNNGGHSLLHSHIMSKVKPVEENGKYKIRVLDNDGDPMYSNSGRDFMTVDEYVKQLKTSPEYAGVFQGSNKTGAGTESSSFKGPEKKVFGMEAIKMGLQQRGI